MLHNEIWTTLRLTAEAYTRDRGPRLAAALAFYAIFSIAPLLVIAAAIASLFYSHDAVRSGLEQEAYLFAGPQVSVFVSDLIARSARPTASVVAGLISLGVLFWGGANLFAQLQDALNTIWGIRPRLTGLIELLRRRSMAFVLVLLTGLLVLLSLAASAVLAIANNAVTGALPAVHAIWPWMTFLGTYATITLAFYLLFRYLPDAQVGRREAWIGAAATGLLFNLGKVLIGQYLERSSLHSTYGAAGSLAALLLWIYFSAQIFFFGAVFTRVYAQRYGTRIVPSARGALIIPERELRARQAADAALRRQIRLAYVARRAAEEEQRALQAAGAGGRRRARRLAPWLAGGAAALAAVVWAVLHQRD